jgi:hypothetical protein
VRARAAFVLIALALLAACDRASPSNTAEVGPPPAPGENQWRYTLAVPAEFVRQDVQGIDSAVAEYRGPGAVLNMDHGMYGGAPTCSSSDCTLSEEELDGHAAVIGRFRFSPAHAKGRGPFFVDVYVELRRHPVEEGLSMRASCRTQAACDQALAIFRSVRFHRT